MGVDAFDIVAIILGVLFTIRKLDAQRRSSKEFPHVPEGEFLRWQRLETSVYTTAMVACFSKVLADWAFVQFLADGLAVRSVRMVGATIDLSWVAVMLWTLYRTSRLSKIRAQLRIVLGGFVVNQGSELSTELKAAMRDLEDGNLERAAYQFKQIALDEDESMKGLSLYYLGECQLRRGEVEDARATFRASLEADPLLMEPREALERLASLAKEDPPAVSE